MRDTGRLREPLRDEAVALLNPRPVTFVDQRVEDLMRQSTIDRAHVLGLVDCGVLTAEHGARLMEAIVDARENSFADFVERPAARGLYTMWEDGLGERLGPLAGMLAAGRSRNDLNATLALLELREVWLRNGDALAALVTTLGSAAERWGDVVMPAYTNGQPAAPMTFGHWLAGVALAVARDLEEWSWQGRRGLARCPLGAAAVAGTSAPIDVEATARRLGFEAPLLNSVDAVASRDPALRLCATAVSVTATLTRVATMLLQWSAGDSRLVRFPDDLSGASSNLPQKRNAFLLEHVAGVHGAVLGAFVAAVAATSKAPFTNSIASGTEAMAVLPAGFAAMHKSCRLSAMVVQGVEPDRERMVRAASNGFTAAASLAELLMASTDLSYREAHHLVGRLVSDLEERGRVLDGLDAVVLADGGVVNPGPLDPAAVLQRIRSAGGPTPQTLRTCRIEIDRVARAWADDADDARRRWAAAASALDASTAALCERASSRKGTP